MLARLQTDHDHIRKTLNLLEKQFLDMCRGQTPDYVMMLSIVVYIQEYPEQAHHPLEDAIYALLLERDHDNTLIRDLIKDHNELEAITRKLRDAIEYMIQGLGNQQRLRQRLSDFISRQRRHIIIEEMEIYPFIERSLSAQDWGTVQSIVPRKGDPVFGERTRSDYERLYHEIEGKVP